MKSAILGTYSYAEFVAVLGGMLPFMAVAYVRHEDPRIPGRWMRRIGTLSTRLSPLWKFSVEGQGPADIQTRGYVVVANHESTADPFLLSHLPWDMRWIAKKELFRYPLVGWAMKLSRDIPLVRGDRESVRQMMDACKETLASGLNVMLFPEGTRSKDATLLPFKNGAFQLAIETGAPILPIALHGTHACRPKGSKWMEEASAVAKILSPIETAGLTLADVERVRDETRASIQSAVDALRLRPDLGARKGS
jgi:1-acyl-sn-glycerol-3-phosphate acyltransferase